MPMLPATPRGRDLRVDADHVAAVVEQGAAGVAGVDRRVGLDHVVDREAVRRLDRAPEAGDDPLGGGAVEPERVADRDRRGRRPRRARESANLSGFAPLGTRSESTETTARSLEGSTPSTSPSIASPSCPKRTEHVRGGADDVGVRDEHPLLAVDQEAGALAGVRADRDDGRARGRVDRARARLASVRLDRLARDGRQRRRAVVRARRRAASRPRTRRRRSPPPRASRRAARSGGGGRPSARSAPASGARLERAPAAAGRRRSSAAPSAASRARSDSSRQPPVHRCLGDPIAERE